MQPVHSAFQQAPCGCRVPEDMGLCVATSSVRSGLSVVNSAGNTEYQVFHEQFAMVKNRRFLSRLYKATRFLRRECACSFQEGMSCYELIGRQTHLY